VIWWFIGGFIVGSGITTFAFLRSAWTDEPAGIVDPDQDEGRAP
jgi:hypothetical protein